MRSKINYILSEEADKDIEDIFDYTVYKFSTQQAILYLEELEQTFQKLLKHPKLGKARDELKVGLFSLPMQSDIIFYRIMDKKLRIVRVLHQSKDVNLFKEKNS